MKMLDKPQAGETWLTRYDREVKLHHLVGANYFYVTPITSPVCTYMSHIRDLIKRIN